MAPHFLGWGRRKKFTIHVKKLQVSGGVIYGPLYNCRESIPTGSLSKVFSAEVIAILRCTEILLTTNLTRKTIYICSDSRVALAALAKTTTESALVWECMQVLEKLSKFKSL
jgi:hypothetical protein